MGWEDYGYGGVQYIDILQRATVPSAERLHGNRSYIFQQDNAACHTAGTVKAFFRDHDIEVMKWPAQSPDMNTIEHLWQVLKQKVQHQKPRNLNELWEMVSQAWEHLTQNDIQAVTSNMGNRVQALVKAKGGATPY